LRSTEFRRDEEMLSIVHRRAEQLHRRRRSQVRSLVGLGTVAAVVAGTVVVLRWPDDASRVKTVAVGSKATSTTLTRQPLTAPEGWTEMSSSPLSPRSKPITAWTGTEMLVWRGEGAFSDTCIGTGGALPVCGEPSRNDGALHNPATNRWRAIPAGPMPDAKGSDVYGPSVRGVWTGRDFVVWGTEAGAGAAYDPQADHWRRIAASPLAPRVGFSMTWTGREAIVFGGLTGHPGDPQSAVELGDGAAYDPVTDRWRALPPAPTTRSGHSALWVNGELVVVGGGHQSSGPVPQVEAYDPTTNRWRSLAAAPIGSSDAVWTGTRVVAIAGRNTVIEAAAYDPTADRWQVLPALPLPGLVGPALAWTGREVVVLGAAFVGGNAGANAIPPGGAYDPSTNTWRTLPSNGLSPRSGQAVVWTGRELLAWGGAAFTGFTSKPFADGARYSPGPGR
jgi:N-acetylneuraminic acid mutarotase